MSDTIAAIITPFGLGAIAVLRISGKNAFTILHALTKKQKFKDRQSTLATIYFQLKPIDKAIITCFPSPHSYTGEDVVEFSVHGGAIIAEEVLSAAIKLGARLAEPGEFTKRAYLNNKMGLLEAESVADLISAETHRAKEHAQQILQGALEKEFLTIQNLLLQIVSTLEISIDFSEENIEIVSYKNVEGQICSIIEKIQGAIDGFIQTRRAQYGATVALVGKPNAGKSRLFNYLVRKNRSIVTDIAGTTRDYITERISLKGYPVTLIDTAGLHNEDLDFLETKGAEKTHEVLQTSDLLVYLVPPKEGATDLGFPTNILTVQSKCDLLPNETLCNKLLRISAKTGDGIDQLIDEIIARLFVAPREGIIHKERHKNILSRMLVPLERTKSGIQNGSPPEIIAEDVRLANIILGELFGKHTTDDVLNNIFSRFCVGK
ncbi:MAG: tRNA uridine-5-carboxymethylaminomethyl(34) synthesis GTPase MnmE [Candidatus Marinimicrobia bacterium]|nr:tRNA uridine-5-carboxymethylaminomethyl(34) synthesis GTPase MnmE [Candidatus Neomarinimicrobiota bacterium]